MNGRFFGRRSNRLEIGALPTLKLSRRSFVRLQRRNWGSRFPTIVNECVRENSDYHRCGRAIDELVIITTRAWEDSLLVRLCGTSRNHSTFLQPWGGNINQAILIPLDTSASWTLEREEASGGCASWALELSRAKKKPICYKITGAADDCFLAFCRRLQTRACSSVGLDYGRDNGVPSATCSKLLKTEGLRAWAPAGRRVVSVARRPSSAPARGTHHMRTASVTGIAFKWKYFSQSSCLSAAVVSCFPEGGGSESRKLVRARVLWPRHPDTQVMK